MNVGINLIANGVGIASDQIINLGALFALAGSPTCPRLTVTSFWIPLKALDYFKTRHLQNKMASILWIHILQLMILCLISLTKMVANWMIFYAKLRLKAVN